MCRQENSRTPTVSTHGCKQGWILNTYWIWHFLVLNFCFLTKKRERKKKEQQLKKDDY